MLRADEIKRILGLEPHPAEGGYFVETYRSELRLPAAVLSSHRGARSAATAIYYLLTRDTFSAMHRLPGDEIFHFYLGDPVEMLQLHADGGGKVVRLGSDLAGGTRPQVVVPGGTWQGSRLAPGGEVALLGATMAPGFEFEDYEPGSRDELTRKYGRFSHLIRDLTRE